jgi:thiol:disulfide interchange protein
MSGRSRRSISHALLGLALAWTEGACGASPNPRDTTPRDTSRAEAPPASIAWEDASPAAFARAAREDRLVLLSLQADWCHWCHVMNDTTLRDPAIVSRLSERFVVVRAEADARPDLADRYGLWGWPATIVLDRKSVV